MHEFGVSLRLEMMVCMVSRVKQSIWKGCRSMEFAAQGIHQEIRSHELATKGDPPKRLENRRYTSSPKEST